MTRLLPLAALMGLLLCADRAPARSTDTGYSAASFYNVANAYARAGKPGLAVLNYERARLLAPDDPDIEANLRFVRTSSRIPPEPRSWFDRAASIAGPTAMAWIGALGLTLVGVGVLSARHYPKRRLMSAAAAAIGIAMLALTACNAWFVWSQLHAAVVIVAATPARVSPVPMGDPLFVLPEAETVSMTAEHEGFVLIKTRPGRMGWVARANIAPVVAAK